uniref:UBA domain-containing protein n=1 Tax=Musca domestica TaxID=7370 RepID=A0A1I8NHN0_MUSDO
MREALFSQDGWGCQHVNQDTNWEVPSSPEPTNKDPSGSPMWKPTVNNGTDLWESNLRNGGQPSQQPVQKTPWGHTPSTNLGGTWGEDDDCNDTSNVWTGGPAGSTGAVVGVAGVAAGTGGAGPSNGPQWGQGGVGVGVSGAGVQSNVTAPGAITGVAPGGASNAVGVNVPGTPGGAGGAGNGWGDPRGGPMGAGGPLDIRSVDPRDPMRAGSAGDPRDMRMLDPRDPIRGDPRGISGRLNGTSEMWGQHHPIAQHQMPGLNKMGVGGPNVGGAGSVGGVPNANSLAGPSTVGGLNAAGNVVGSQWGGPPQSVVGGAKDMVGSMAPKPPGGGSGWEEPSPPPQRRNIPNYDDGTSLWGQQSRVPGGVGIGGGGSHWKDVSDPLNARSHLMRNALGVQNAPNASIVSGLGGAGGAGSGAGGLGAPGNPNNSMGVGAVGPPGPRLVSAIGGPGGVGGPHKPDNGMWSHPTGPPNVSSAGVGGNRNTGGWGDVENHNVVGGSGSGVSGTGAGNWGDDKSNQIGGMGQTGNSWNEPPNASAWNKPNQAKLPNANTAGGWGSVGGAGTGGANDGNDLNPNDWSAAAAAHNSIMSKAQQQQKLGTAGVNLGGINTELIKQSKQYRMLVEAGFKKEDAERALISANMNLDEANEMLRSNLSMVSGMTGGMDNWRRHDDTLGSYADHNSAATAGGGAFPGRYASAATQPAMSFPPNNLLNSMGGGAVGAGGNNPQLNALNAMQPLQVQKYLNQGPHNVGAAGPPTVNPAVAFGQGSNVAAVNAAAAAVSNSTNQPSTQQLRMLVQQIQLAVQSGYLSSQILNQPLAPTTLLLLNQLLSNIKHLQGAQQSLARSGNNGNTLLAIAKYKQQIQNLQNQINAQQAIHIKQQQALQPNPHPAAAHINNTNNEYLRSHDSMTALQGNFSEMNLNKSAGYQGAPNQQSRLNQWKLPVSDKDMTTDSTDFSRAPGATKQGSGGLMTTNATNMGPLGLQSDGTWSTGRNINDGWPDHTNDSENKDWSVGHASAATAYTDLVQEFEPGKPWKGSQIKSIEDDPSITPGSVARSPLAINATPKDADIFANATSKNSPTDLPTLGLTTSSTWSFNPPNNNQNFQSWSDTTQQEIWSSMNKTSRGPPPGLGSNKSGVGMPNVGNPGNAGGWLTGGNSVRTAGGWSGTNSNWNSNWLLLKNLTTQIDSSTLRTLCMQHGPLQTFHLYLNQGIALCKYASREEASKAQMTLNNCFLGNSTIIAESPSENEVHSILHHLPQQNTNATATQQHAQQGGGGGGGQNSSHNNAGGGMNNPGGGGGSSNTNANNVNNVNNASGSQNPTSAGGNNVNPQSNTSSNNSSNANAVNNGINNSGQNGNQPSNHNSHPNANTQNTANVATNNTNVAANNSSNANANQAWRSTTNQQQQQQQQQQSLNSQTRPSGGRDDFDIISKYVCSIVDD